MEVLKIAWFPWLLTTLTFVMVGFGFPMLVNLLKHHFTLVY